MKRHQLLLWARGGVAITAFVSITAAAEPAFVRAESAGALTEIASDEAFNLGATALSVRTQRDVRDGNDIVVVNQTRRTLWLSPDGGRFSAVAAGERLKHACATAQPRAVLVIAVDDLGSRFEKSLVPNCGDQLAVREYGVAVVLPKVGKQVQP